MNCGKFYSLNEMLQARGSSPDGIPRCACGGIIKPDVVLYEESLDQKTLQSSIDAIRQATMLIVAGTSLSVYPAAGLLEYFQGECLAVVNRDATPADKAADICIHANVGDVLDF